MRIPQAKSYNENFHLSLYHSIAFIQNYFMNGKPALFDLSIFLSVYFPKSPTILLIVFMLKIKNMCKSVDLSLFLYRALFKDRLLLS